MVKYRWERGMIIMICKKNIAVIITLVFLLLLMMTTTMQAATPGKVYNLKANMQDNVGYFTWSYVSGADGYDVFISTSGRSYEYIGSVLGEQATVIGFQKDKSYSIKIRAYEKDSNGSKVTGSFSDVININSQEESETTLSQVKNLTAVQNGGNVSLNWSKVSYADGYEVYVNIANTGFFNLGSVASNQAIIMGFQDGKTYEFKVRAYEKLSSGKLSYGDFSTTKKLTIDLDKYEDLEEEIQKPAQVKGLSIDEIDGRKVSISWSEVDDADGYQVYIIRTDGGYAYQQKYTRTSATISLQYDTSYRVKVTAYKNTKDGILYGADSTTRSFRTEEEEVNLSAPRNVQVTNISSNNYVTLSWNKVAYADGYRIYLTEKGYNNYQLEKTTTSTVTTLTGLPYNKTYRLKVVPYQVINGTRVEGTPSSAITFATLRQNTTTSSLDKVTNLSVKVQNRNEASLVWWPVDNADGYEVYVSRKNGSYQKDCDVTIGNSAILYSLDYETNYKVKVRAFCYINGQKVYSKNYSDVKRFKTESYNPNEGNVNVPTVKNVVANVVGDTVYLSWSKVTGAVKYEIDFTVPGLGGSTKFTVYTTSRAISGLQRKNAFYTARVRAYKYVNGRLVCGEYSEIQKFTGK